MMADAARLRQASGGAPCSSSTRSTASTAPSRTPSCPTSSAATSCWSARPPRTRRSSSTRRCSRAAGWWSSSRWRRELATLLAPRAGRPRARPRRRRRWRWTTTRLATRAPGAAATRGAPSTCSSWWSPTPVDGGPIVAAEASRRRAAQDAALRQGRRGALQSHLGAPQVAARERSRRRALLAGAHARGRARTRSTWRAAWCASPARTSASPIRQALLQALAGWQAYDQLGSPEGDLALAQVALYLALAPKSIAVYGRSAPPAARSRSARPSRCRSPSATPPTALMDELGYGSDYVYAPRRRGGRRRPRLPARLRSRAPASTSPTHAPASRPSCASGWKSTAPCARAPARGAASIAEPRPGRA